MPQPATIRSLPAAFAVMKAMEAEGAEWGEDYRAGARQTLAELLEGRMFAVFMHENRNQGLATPFALTQTF
jgi:hypothetical protein